MADKAYESACLRAELFGDEKPNKEDFLEKNKHLDIITNEGEGMMEALEEGNTEIENEGYNQVREGLAELNTLLGSTQNKLNRFKNACGSLTNLFRLKLGNTKENLSYSSAPSYVGQTPVDADLASTSKAGPLPKSDINDAIRDLEKMEQLEVTPIISKATAKDVKEQVNSQIDKLDSLISGANSAELSMQHQNKLMRTFLK